jgi:ankyrin repeat protein
VAVEAGHMAVVKVLLRSLVSTGSDLTTANEAGNTALHVAVIQGDAAAVEPL